MTQCVYEGFDKYKEISSVIKAVNAGNILVVCSGSLEQRFGGIKQLLDTHAAQGVKITYFTGYSPNPAYDDILNGIKLSGSRDFDLIISVGGGSAIDTAKCINICDPAGDDGVKLLGHSRCRHLAVPTTAGSGSEATGIAVIYVNGAKHSVDHSGILPEFVILDPGLLAPLPLYHKKSTMFDALCQGIESLWARASTDESSIYASEAINLILGNTDGYFAGDNKSAMLMMKAAYLSGKAINISRTTAAHAMSYKLTGMFGIAHGHAAALCLPHIWAQMRASGLAAIDNISRFDDIAAALVKLLISLDMRFDFIYDDNVVNKLADSVNILRLNNHPVVLSRDDLIALYRKVLDNALFDNPGIATA